MTFDETTIREQLEICDKADCECYIGTNAAVDEHVIEFIECPLHSPSADKLLPAALREILRLRGWLEWIATTQSPDHDMDFVQWMLKGKALAGEPAPESKQ